MGFLMVHENQHYYPKISCDVCDRVNESNQLNFEHSEDGGETRVICKECSRNEDSDRKLLPNYHFPCWMPMDAYLVALEHNSKVDKGAGEAYLNASLG